MISRADVLAAVKDAEPTTCEGYRKLLERLVHEGPMNEDGARLVGALAAACCLQLRPRQPEPLTPWFEGSSPLPGDMAPEMLDELKDIAAELPIDLRARIHDVLWIGRRDVEAGRAAVADYAETIRVLSSPENSGAIRARVDRALGIAGMMHQQELEEVITAEALGLVNSADSPGAARVWVADVLIERRAAGSENLGALVESIASSAHPKQGVPADWNWVRYAWQVAADAYKAGGDAERGRAARIKRATTFEQQAHWLASVGPTSSFTRANLIRDGILAFRRIGGCQTQCAALESMLEVAQAGVLDEMAHFESDAYNLGQHALDAIDRVKGCSWPQALSRLSRMVPPARVEDLRELVTREAEQHPLGFLIRRTVLDVKGRTVAADKGDDIFESQIHRHATLHRQVCVLAIIDPARRQIACEHPATTADWLSVLRPSDLLESSRIECWVKGLTAGLRGDFIVSTHLLVPQLEHWIRRVIESRGGSATAMDDDGVQRGNALGALLADPILTDTLGEDVVFDLEGLLVWPGSANIRNLLAHGMLSDADFRQIEMVYVWYVCLRLLVLSSTAFPATS